MCGGMTNVTCKWKKKNERKKDKENLSTMFGICKCFWGKWMFKYVLNFHLTKNMLYVFNFLKLIFACKSSNKSFRRQPCNALFKITLCIVLMFHTNVYYHQYYFLYCIRRISMSKLRKLQFLRDNTINKM